MKTSKGLLQSFSLEMSKLNVVRPGNAKLWKIHQCNVSNELNCTLFGHKITKNIFVNIFEHRLEYNTFFPKTSTKNCKTG